jgi:hypothetical protein
MRLRVASLAALFVASAGAAQASGPVDLFYERSLMRAADQRCGLFDRPVAVALAVAAAQAEGAAVRAGVQPKHLAQIELRARRRASETACGSADLQLAAARVRDAFDGWARTVRITFPGTAADWRADRTPTRTLRWRLVQSMGADQFGVAGRGTDQALVAVTTAEGRRPYAARLVLRDSARDPRPWLGDVGRAAGARTIFAQAASAAEAALLPAGRKAGLAFRFPREASDAIAALDTRESFAVEYLYATPDGGPDRVRRVRFEVGDFAAAHAFLALGGPGSAG